MRLCIYLENRIFAYIKKGGDFKVTTIHIKLRNYKRNDLMITHLKIKDSRFKIQDKRQFWASILNSIRTTISPNNVQCRIGNYRM